MPLPRFTFGKNGNGLVRRGSYFTFRVMLMWADGVELLPSLCFIFVFVTHKSTRAAM